MTVDILFLAKSVTAIAGAAIVIFKIIKPILQIVKKVEKLEAHQHETYMQMLRLVIVSDEMPLEERIKAGDEYVKAGGNGAIKHIYQNLLEKLPK